MAKNGTYRFVYTYAEYNSAGTMVYETGRSPIQGPVTVTGTTSIQVVYTSNTRINKIRIYSTLAGGAVYYLEKVIDNVTAGTSVWTTLSMADSTLEDQASAYFTNKGYETKRLYTSGVLHPLRYVITASQRLWGAGRMHRTGTNEDATLYWSELAPEWYDWPAVNGNSIFAKPITGLYEENELVYVFTRDTRWRVTPAGYNEALQFDQLEGGVGCVGHHTIARIGAATMWLAQDGFYVSSGTAEPVNVSGPIEGTIDSLRMDRALFFMAEPFDRVRHEYRCWVSTSSSELNDMCLVYDMRSGITNGRWVVQGGLGRTAVYAGSAIWPDGRTIYMIGDHLGCVWQKDIGHTDGMGVGGTYQGLLGPGTTSTTTTSTTTTTTTTTTTSTTT